MSPLHSMHRPAAAALWLLAAACTSVGPDFTPPTPPPLQAWQQAQEAGLVDAPPAHGAFWRDFGDPLLASLVERALQQNLDLRAAYTRLAASASLRGIAAADQWPGLDGRGSYEHRRESKNTPFGAFIPRTNIHAIGVDAAWELDLWGRVRRSIEAAEHELAASAADLEAAGLAIAAEVVRTYIDLRAAQQRLRIGNANLQLQQQTLELVRARLTAGLVVERDVAQAATNVESTRARLPMLVVEAQAAQNRLAVLLGEVPGALSAELNALQALPTPPARLAVGQPADLLRRRADVMAAEHRLAAEVARIGITEAERYPQFALNGTLGIAANSAEDLFRDGSGVFAFGPSLRWNLFDGGRLRHRLTALTATAEAAQIAWEQTVLLALEEAENAMTRYAREHERRAALQQAATQARRAVELAQTQYRAGLSDFQAVIDSERTVALLEDDLISSEAAIANSMVALCKALGGEVLGTTTAASR